MIRKSLIVFVALGLSHAAYADPLPALVGNNLFGQSKAASSVPSTTVVTPAASAPVAAPVASVKVPVLVPLKTQDQQASITAVEKPAPAHKHHKYVETKRVLNDDGVVFYDFSEKKKVVEKKKPSPLEVPLPGLGTLQGDRLLSKSAVIRVNGDGTEVVEISDQFQNRISTPFENPKVIDSSHADYKIDGSSIYVSLSGQPVVVYITGSNRSDPVISLTLVPKPIPAQTLVLQLDQPVLPDRTQIKKHKPESYEQDLASLLSTVAEDATPEGFTEAKISNVAARKGVLSIIPSKRYSNANMDIFVYDVINTSKDTLQLSETSFYTKGVMAVGMFPASTLKRNEDTYVYVVSNKLALGDSNGR